MKNETSGCGREDELVSYLYGELEEREAGEFQRHLQNCNACGRELESFANVRSSVVAWRDEALAGIASPAPLQANPPSRSAIAALREFFSLSPMWLKGATAFASVLFVVFMFLAVAHWRETPAPTVASGKQESAEQVKALQAEIAELKARNARFNSSATSGTSAPGSSAVTVAVDHSKTRGTMKNKATVARRPLSKSERDQLAYDLRLTQPKENELDLLGDRMNE